MPRMQVYLPEELYREVKERGLPASELLQAAVTAEVRRLEQLRNIDEYLDDLIAEIGDPSAEAEARAEALVNRIEAHLDANRPDWRRDARP